MPYSFLTNHHPYNPAELLEELQVSPGHSVLDLGCGHQGYWTFPLAQRVGKSGQVHCVDIDPRAIDNISRKSAELKLSQINACRLDLENLSNCNLSAVDIALLVNVLYQIKYRNKLISMLASLIKPGGKLLLVDWKRNASSYGPPQELRVAADYLKRWLTRAKFEVIREMPLGDDHFANILMKR
ncbi:MAG TPA: class I SAM-dependent methyltransferase [Candidatus Bipolaricaulota bacterium]|nr:class I SAM-dependent methyltransferase [Candidatus Bipolaricaulota bacterium]